MKRIPALTIALLLLLSALLPACSSLLPAAQPTAAPVVAPVVDTNAAIVVQGKLVPRNSIELSFEKGGQIDEVLVKEGDLVQAGDVIARLGNREELEANIAEAEREMLSAQQAYDDLFNTLQADQNQALQELKDARDAEHAAERLVKIYENPVGTQQDIELAKAAVTIAQDELDRAKKQFKYYENKPEDNVDRAQAYQALQAAQDKYDRAVRNYNSVSGQGSGVSDFDQQQAQTDLVIAQNRLDLAQKKVDLIASGPDPATVKAAEARITAAKASLQAANATLNNLELIATISGTVVNLDLTTGQQVSPGQSVIEIADFSEWYVETDDLTEINVVHIDRDQKVKIVPDALPDLEMTGVVDTISDTYVEKRGDITYTTKIRVDKIDPRLRWGMTVQVTFEEPGGSQE